jgi:hypothetical protein
MVSNPDADHIGEFLDVFDAFPVETVYVSGNPKGTLTYNSFLRGVREEGSEVEEVRAGYRMDWGGVRADVIAPPPGELFSETNDNSVAILLSYGGARVLLDSDAEAMGEEYMIKGAYMRPLLSLGLRLPVALSCASTSGPQVRGHRLPAAPKSAEWDVVTLFARWGGNSDHAVRTANRDGKGKNTSDPGPSDVYGRRSRH